MIGLKRLDNIEYCVTEVISDHIPGDLLEAGVWRGGAWSIMRAVLLANGITDRRVWVADSFQGLPPPNPAVPADSQDKHYTQEALAITLEEVRGNFTKYGLLDDQVNFLPGWFSETLYEAPTGPLAVLRADADMYGSTMDILRALYPRVSPGGFVIIDDYSNQDLVACRKAVTDYRYEFGITEPLTPIDWTGVYWRKQVTATIAIARRQAIRLLFHGIVKTLSPRQVPVNDGIPMVSIPDASAEDVTYSRHSRTFN